MNLLKEVKKAKKGNKAAFETIIYEHRNIMYHIAKSILKKDEDCKDAIQEAIFNAYRSISNLREPKYFKTWLLRIVMNECYNIIRNREKVVPLKDWENPYKEEKGYEAIEIQMLLGSLSEEDAQMLNMFYIEDLTIKDIASLLSMPENTVKTRIRRAKEKLNRTLAVNKDGGVV